MGNQCMNCLDVNELNKEIFIEDGVVFDTEKSLQFEIERESLISEDQQSIKQKSLFHYFTQSYMKELFDNFELFGDQLKEMKNQKEAKIFQEKSKFDKKLKCFWCKFIDQENNDNKIHQYYVENISCFTPAMINLFDMNIDENIQKKINDQVEEYEVISCEKNDKYIIIISKQKTIKSFLNSSKYFFNVTIYKKNQQNQFSKLSSSVQLTELFKDEYYKKISDQLNPQMLTIMNIQQFEVQGKDTLMIDISKIDPLNQVGLRLAKGFMKKVFKKYSEEYRKQLVEFIIKQKKKGIDDNLLWFNNDKKEIKNIIKQNFNLIQQSDIQINMLTEEIKTLYENKSMINSDLLDSEELSDMQEIETSKKQFSIFDYPQIKDNNKIDSFQINSNNMSPIKPLDDQQKNKKQISENVIKFFKEDIDDKISDNNQTPFSVQESQNQTDRFRPTMDFADEQNQQIQQKDNDIILKNIENSNIIQKQSDKQIDDKNKQEEEQIGDLNKQNDDQEIIEQDVPQQDKIDFVDENVKQEQNLQNISQQIVTEQQNDDKVQNIQHKQEQENLKEQEDDFEEIDDEKELSQNEPQIEAQVLKIENDNLNQEQKNEKHIEKSTEENVINDSFLSNQSSKKDIQEQQDEDQTENIEQFAKHFINDIVDNAIQQNTEQNVLNNESANLNLTQEQQQLEQKKPLKETEIVDKEGSFKLIDIQNNDSTNLNSMLEQQQQVEQKRLQKETEIVEKEGNSKLIDTQNNKSKNLNLIQEQQQQQLEEKKPQKETETVEKEGSFKLIDIQNNQIYNSNEI